MAKMDLAIQIYHFIWDGWLDIWTSWGFVGRAFSVCDGDNGWCLSSSDVSSAHSFLLDKINAITFDTSFLPIFFTLWNLKFCDLIYFHRRPHAAHLPFLVHHVNILPYSLRGWLLSSQPDISVFCPFWRLEIVYIVKGLEPLRSLDLILHKHRMLFHRSSNHVSVVPQTFFSTPRGSFHPTLPWLNVIHEGHMLFSWEGVPDAEMSWASDDLCIYVLLLTQHIYLGFNLEDRTPFAYFYYLAKFLFE